MSPIKRLKPVQRVSESREQHAARELGISQRKARDQQARLDELRRYHQEYLERFRQASRAGMASSHLLEYRAFLGNLEKAIEAQEKIVSAGSQECVSRKATWQQKHMRTKILGKVMDRFETASKTAEQARDQKESDDRNQRGGDGG